MPFVFKNSLTKVPSSAGPISHFNVNLFKYITLSIYLQQTSHELVSRTGMDGNEQIVLSRLRRDTGLISHLDEPSLNDAVICKSSFLRLALTHMYDASAIRAAHPTVRNTRLLMDAISAICIASIDG